MTVKKVAELAGVSIGTVSRVLNGKSDVSEEYVHKVEEAIRKLGYRPNLLAAGLRKRKALEEGSPSDLCRTGNIGFLVDFPTTQAFIENEFQASFLLGVSDRLAEKEQQMLFQSFSRDAQAGRMPLMVRKSSVDGVILKGFLATEELEWVESLAQVVPVVILMDLAPPGATRISSIMCDNRSGVFQAMRYLQSLGHQRIGFLNVRDAGRRRLVHHEQRMRAYEDAVHELHLDDRPGYLQVLERDLESQSFESIVDQALSAWLDMGKDRPTAVMNVADAHALCLMDLAKSRGLEIPRDLSVIGYMNTATAQVSIPPLTSVAISGREMGCEAVDLLLKMIENPSLPSCQLVVDGQLVERLSCSQPF